MGMMTDTSGGYNGIVSVGNDKVRVNEGVAELGGAKFMVSDDGSLVMDENQRAVGYVENGIFKPLDEQHIAKLKKMGAIQ